MTLTPRTIEVLKDRYLPIAEGLTPEELERELDQFFKGIHNMRRLPQPRYLMEDWIPAGATVFLSAHGQSGKTLISLAWATCISRGWSWAGKKVLDPGLVLYITQEGANSIPYRLEAYMRLRDGDPEDGDEGIWLYPKQMRLGAAADQRGGVPQYGEDWDKLAAWISEHKPKAVFLDPWADHFNLGQENSNDDVRAWTSKARELLGINGEDAPALIILAHTSHENKRGGSPRGASAAYDGADRVYTVTPVFPTEDRSGGYSTQGDLLGVKLSTEKSKDGGRPGPWYGELHVVDVEGALNDKSIALDGVSPERFRDLEQIAKTGFVEQRQGNASTMWTRQILEHLARSPGTKRSVFIDSPGVLKGKNSAKREHINMLIGEGILIEDDGLYIASKLEPDEL